MQAKPKSLGGKPRPPVEMFPPFMTFKSGGFIGFYIRQTLSDRPATFDG